MNAFAGYDYNPSTGTYTKNPNWRPPPAAGSQPSAPSSSSSGVASIPPPRPPKELAGNVDSQIIKESQYDNQAAELDSEPRYSMDSLTQQTLHQIQTVSQGPRKARILSLDGGGIRGYSTLIILQELMHQVYVYTHNGKGPKTPADLPRPCDYFDLIAGNGTGGLIALMLGRMRMNVETCKETYVSLTRFVFITDKTLLGMPYGKTLFKASRLEEAIKYCVESATRYDHLPIIPGSPPPLEQSDSYTRPVHRRSDSWRRRSDRRESSGSVGTISGRTSSRIGHYESGRSSRASNASTRGNVNAPLLDTREGACKTFVTAMLKGSRKGAAPVLLRSYPSSAESVPSYKMTIWEAGRATCATAQAFKPITIDQTTFLDEGFGRYNPAFEVLEEVREHEFPDAHICPFVSIGTGKRPKSQLGTESRREWWEGVAFEDFAEAKRRLIRRTDDCERVHRELVDGVDGGRPRLAKGGVAAEDYYRFNVEVGVGEFGMNEWNRLAEVATGTRRYLAQRETARFVKECAVKLVEAARAQQNHNFPPPQVAKLPRQRKQSSSGVAPSRPRVPSDPVAPHQLPHQAQYSHPSQAPFTPPPSTHHSPPAMDEKEVVVGPVPPPHPQYSTPPPGQNAYAKPPPIPPQVQRYNGPPAHASTPPQTHPAYRPPPPVQGGYTSTPPASVNHPQGRPNDPPYPKENPFPVLPLRQQQAAAAAAQQPPPRPPLPPGVSSQQQQPDPTPVPIHAPKPGKVVLPGKHYDEDDTPNPEIRVTSPTTVAGGSDDEDDEVPGYGRRRRRRLRSASRGRRGNGLDEIDE